MPNITTNHAITYTYFLKYTVKIIVAFLKMTIFCLRSLRKLKFLVALKKMDEVIKSRYNAQAIYPKRTF